jgi:polyribonucleotide nucleotidyltransferase
MNAAFDMRNLTLPPSVGRIRTIEVPNKSVGRIIGPGGVSINAIIAESGVDTINIDKGDPATITITSTSDAAIAAALQLIQNMLSDSVVPVTGPRPPPPPPILVGDTFAGCEVKNMVPFGGA